MDGEVDGWRCGWGGGWRCVWGGGCDGGMGEEVGGMEVWVGRWMDGGVGGEVDGWRCGWDGGENGEVAVMEVCVEKWV